MKYFPIFLKLESKPCLVVGGGDIAYRKVELLRRAGAAVTVVAPEVCDDMAALAKSKKITHINTEFSEDMATGQSVIIAATDNKTVNALVASIAEKLNIPVNVVDTPDLCGFIVPSIIDRSPIVVAVSSGGASPVLARLIRAKLETTIPAAYGRLALLAKEFRDNVKQTFSSINDRRKFWEKVLQGRIAELVFSGQEQQAKSELEKELKNSADGSEVGEVYLVGGGPGDPDLLTFRALRLMQQADVIVHDRLVSPEVLDLVRRDAVRIYAGKEKDKHAIPQDQINTLLVKLAKEGKRVCRLKGGDPFIFGRGGEEIELLAKEQIPFQVVPGITAAAGCASYAGIPLTHRDYSQSVAFVTGHLKDGNFNLNWDGIAKPNQTLVIYMGLVGIKDLCKELITHGLKEDMPVALVQQGTTRHQRVIVGNLQNMPAKVKANKIKAPTLIIVGEVVKLRESLNWFHPEEN